MSLAARSPRSRKSLSLHDSNKDNVTLPSTSTSLSAKGKGKKGSRMSFAGEGMSGSTFTFGKTAPAKELAVAPAAEAEMSPRRKARRSMQPRKSILKGLSTLGSPKMQRPTSFSDIAEDQHAHTIAFSLPITTGDETNSKASLTRRQSLGRRVSFAAHAHVRMFDKAPSASSSSGNPFAPVPLPPKAAGQPHTHHGGSSRPSQAHSRRSSIQIIPAISSDSVLGVAEEADGSMDMELETESESSDQSSEDEAEATAPMVLPSKRFSGPGGAFSLGGAAQAEEEDDMDMDMDETRIIHGGIVSRPQGGDFSDEDDEDEDADVTRDSNMSMGEEDKTMDFTVAMGGLIPALPPAGAVNNRQSIGYTVPTDRAMAPFQPAHAEEDSVEMDMDMDETIAFGGIVTGDESMSMSSGGEDTSRDQGDRTMTFAFGRAFGQPEEDGGMEFTIAAGGILSVSHETTVAPTLPPSQNTPSFARPTASSQLKEKRNIFGPSPSPAKSTTPRSAGLEAAKDVAKRLSFGSVTGSGGTKRSLEDVGGTPSKQMRLGPGSDFVFDGPSLSGSPYKSPRKLLGAPSPHRQSLAPRSPARDAEWAQPAITLAAFLEMAGVGFMEGLPGVGRRRRSSVARGVLGDGAQNGDREYPVQAYTEAQVMSVFHHMYIWASSKMKEDISQGLAEIAETETLFSRVNPPGIQDYLCAQDEEKVHFEQLFKEYKTNTHLNAKTRWYDWKQSVVARIKPDVDELLVGMRQDDATLIELSEQTDVLLPGLHSRLAALQAQLTSERKIVAEIEQCDPEQLQEYREAIAEQGSQITNFNVELAEATTKLEALDIKLKELSGKRQDSISAISVAKSKCDQFTRSDIGKLRAEYASLQHMHLWRLVNIQPDILELEYDHEICLTFQCTNSVPLAASATMELLPETHGIKHGKPRGPVNKGAGPTDALFQIFQATMREDLKSSSATTLVRRAGQLWAAAQRLRGELRIISLCYPSKYTLSPDGDSLEIGVAVLLPAIRSKAEITLVATACILREWPSSVANIEVCVKTIYGSADSEVLRRAVQDEIAKTVDEGYLTGLLQSVDAAQQSYAEGL